MNRQRNVFWNGSSTPSGFGIESARLVRQWQSTRRIVGFSLSETLVAVAVIAFLFALISPTVRSVMERGKSAKCVSNIRQLGNEIGIMVADLGHFPAGLDLESGEGGGSTSNTARSWDVQVRDLPCVGCPSAKFNGPHPSDTNRMISAYSANPMICGNVLNGDPPYVRMANISRPSQVVLLTDGAQFNRPTNPRSINFSAAWWMSREGNPNNAERPLTTTLVPAGGFWDPEVSLIPMRHNGRANILFVDGHVESIGNISELKEKNLYWNY